jgi:hypothetical protein
MPTGASIGGWRCIRERAARLTRRDNPGWPTNFFTASAFPKRKPVETLAGLSMSSYAAVGSAIPTV